MQHDKAFGVFIHVALIRSQEHYSLKQRRIMYLYYYKDIKHLNCYNCMQSNIQKAHELELKQEHKIKILK